jgi:hypothetical protein
VPTAVDQILWMTEAQDPYSLPLADISQVQLAAAQYRLAQRREQIPVLDRRAKDVGIEKLNGIEDLIPLLFSHTTYKAYPNSFITNGRWDKLLEWYATLASQPVDNVDLSDVVDVDGWVSALWHAGHRVTASSGTSGKSSFLPATMSDRALVARILRKNAFWPEPPPPENSLLWYQLTPRTGPYRIVDSLNALAELMAVPGSPRYLTDRPMLISEVTRANALRQAMAEGSALPSDLKNFDSDAGARADEMERTTRELAESIASNVNAPMCIIGNWAQQWRLVELLSGMGIQAGSFHRDSLVIGAGGTKGVVLPEGYKDTVYTFYGDVRRPLTYGMSEVTPPSCMCSSRNYHLAPWTILLVLGQSAEKLLNAPAEQVVGRAAFFDLVTEGRWGGIITGDRIEVDFRQCACGRPGPTIADTVTRYSELEGNDDKLSCAGTMEAYVRLIMNDHSDNEGIE